MARGMRLVRRSAVAAAAAVMLGMLVSTVAASGSGEGRVVDRRVYNDLAYAGADAPPDGAWVTYWNDVPVHPEATHASVVVDWVTVAGPGGMRVRLEHLNAPTPLAEVSGRAPLTLSMGVGDLERFAVRLSAGDLATAVRDVVVAVTLTAEAKEAWSADSSDRGVAPAPAGVVPTADWDPDATRRLWMVAIAAAGFTILAIPIVSSYNRIRPHRLLEHPRRRAILDAVAKHPGIHFHALRQLLDLREGAANHHARMLVAAGVLHERRVLRRRCLFVSDAVPPDLEEALGHVRAPAAWRILRVVAASDCRGVREMARATGLAPSTVTYHLGTLERGGLVAVARGGPVQRVTPTALGRRLLAYPSL